MDLTRLLDNDQARFGLSLLAAASPTVEPVGFGSRLASGIGMYDAWKESKRRAEQENADRALRNVMMQKQLAAIAEEQKRQQQRDSYLDSVDTAAGPARPVSVAQAMRAGLGVQEIGALLPQGSERKIVGNPKEGIWDITDPVHPVQLVKPQSEFNVVLSEAGIDPKSPKGQSLYDQYLQKKVYTGPTSVTDISIDNTGGKLIDSFVSAYGKRLDKNAEEAEKAVEAINNAQKIMSAIDSGNVVAGPGANFKIFALRLGQTLGIGGENGTEILKNTRNVIQSLAQAELDAAMQARGSGAITENERDIIKRAASGQIEELTAPEIKLLSQAIEKTARFKIQQYNKKAKLASNIKGAEQIVPFLAVEEPAPYKNTRRFEVLGVEK